MLKKINTWYQAQAPLKQLGFAFLFNYLLWFIVFYIGDLIFSDVRENMKHKLVLTSSVAFCLTLFNNWKLVKQVFSKKQESSASTNNEPSAF